MALESQNQEHNECYLSEKEEGEVDLEGELMKMKRRYFVFKFSYGIYLGLVGYDPTTMHSIPCMHTTSIPHAWLTQSLHAGLIHQTNSSYQCIKLSKHQPMIHT